MKICSKCQETKPLTEFYPNSTYADGYQGQCKACQRARSQASAAARKASPVEPPAEKRCPLCGDTKPSSEFSRKRSRHDGLAERCRPCTAHVKRLERYGVDPEWYKAQWEKQEGRCLICTAELSEVGDHVDHCHDTLEPRGLLCGHCNRGLGLFRDSIPNLRRAIEYLEGAW